jgi:hypothetical protein
VKTHEAPLIFVKVPHGEFPMGRNSPWGIFKKVYRVLNIAEFNTKMWMVHFLDIDKAFINFFTACEKSENS